MLFYVIKVSKLGHLGHCGISFEYNNNIVYNIDYYFELTAFVRLVKFGQWTPPVFDTVSQFLVKWPLISAVKTVKPCQKLGVSR